MTSEERDDDLYFSKEQRENLEENDEIDEVEEAFMQGYEAGENIAQCATCKAILTDTNFIEEEFNEEIRRFCSTRCQEIFHKKEQD